MKLIIIVDSSCGLTKKEAEERGWYFLPLFLTIDGKEYMDGIDITPKNFFDICKIDSIVSSSCSTPMQIEIFLNKIINPNSFVVIYPISKYLSSQYSNFLAVVKNNNYKNIHIIDSKNISIPIIKELVELEIGVKNKEFSIEEGIDIIENQTPRNLNNMILFPKYNDNLVRGGRLSSSEAKVANFLKIIPIITLREGRLEKLGKGRVFKKTVINKTVEIYKTLNDKSEEWTLMYGYSGKIDELIYDEIKEKTSGQKPFINLYIPSIISIHTGLEAITPCFLNLKYDVEKYGFDKIKGEA